ncbi:MAG: ATP-binding protein [Ktedonobacteraceae bacterium]|nr:ATP-binding protein [Ktedonobacteraceae bacterium]
MLIAMAGLPGTGKSSIAQRLAPKLQGVILSKDTIRAALFPAAKIEYSTQQDDFCQAVMMQVARYLVERDANICVIFDGRTFSRRYQLQLLLDLAQDLRTPLKIVQCICSDETARQRLERDSAYGLHLARNRDYALYLSVKARFEEITEPKLVVNTEKDIEVCVEQCLSYILSL